MRLSTPFRYPNGEHVDVFLYSDKALFPDLYLTDYGQTSQYLKDSSVVWDSTFRKRELVGDILARSGVRLDGQQLTIRPHTTDQQGVTDAIFLLAQICVRLADLATHQRLRSTNPFRDDVEEFFEAHSFRYEANVKLPPVFGERDLRMDFEVKHGNKSHYVNVIGAMNDAAAHAAANEINIKWRDLQESGQIFFQGFVTVFNSESSAIRAEDLERLSRLSSVIAYPEQSLYLAAMLTDNLTEVTV